MPATITWIGTDGNWNDSSKWSGGTVPTASDDVIINPAGGDFTVTISDGRSAHSLTMSGDDNLAITGSLALASVSSVHDLGISGNGILAASTSVTVTLSGAGTWSDQGTLAGPGAFVNTGSLSITGGDPNLRAELQNKGTITQGNAHLDFDDPAGKLRVVDGGIYKTANTQNDWGFRQSNGGQGVFVESGGTFQHDSSTNARFLTNASNNPGFNVNGGTIDVVHGTLGIDSSGSLSNVAVKVAANAALNFLNGANLTVQGTIAGTGAGTVNLTEGGVLSVDGSGATFNFASGLFQWSSQGTIAGSGVLKNTGALNIVSGDPNLRTELQNTGTIIHGNAHLDFDDAGGKLRVLSGGVYKTTNTQNDWGFRQTNGGQGVFIESGGIFRHDSSTNARFLTNASNNPAFNVSGGTLDIVHGTLGVNSSGAFTNTSIIVGSGGALNFLNGASITVKGTLSGSGSDQGTGVVNLTEGGVLAIDSNGAAFSFPENVFQLSNQGTIAGPGVLTNTGFLQIISGDPNLRTELQNKGTITQGNAHLDLDAAAGKLRVLSGGFYITTNTENDWGIRQVNGGQGLFVESGGTFRHNSASGARFLTNTGNNPGFSVSGGTIDIVHGTLGVNSSGAFTDTTIKVATDSALNFLNGASIAVKGALTGTGDGTVNLTESGILSVDPTGASFDFVTGMFRWSNQGTIAGPGVATNLGVMAITGGDPNLRTELVNKGTISQGDAHLDFDDPAGKLRVVAGGLYVTTNTQNDWGFRQFNGGQGVSIEAGGIFRHNSATGARFLTNATNAPAFNVNGGTLDVVNGTLGVNTGGTFTNATLNVAASAALNFLNGANVTVQGTLTGSGSGVVNLTEGSVLTIPDAGATLSFPAGVFQWSNQGAIQGTGVVTNSGWLSITGGDPNLRTEMQNKGTIIQGNAHLDFDQPNGQLRVLDGGVYVVNNTQNDWGVRQFNGGKGLSIESGGVFRLDSPNGSRFLTNTANNPAFNVSGGTVDVVKGTLGVNSSGAFTDVNVTVGASGALNFLTGANVTIQGAFTGTGAGTVNLTEGGVLAIASGGASLNFSGNLFQWSNQGAIAGPGVVTNLGTLTIASGDPNLRTEMQNKGAIIQGNAHLDFDDPAGKLRVLDGGVYTAVNTQNDWGFRQFNGGQGVSVETGGTFRHNSPNNSRFLTNAANGPQFSNTGTVEVVKGTLYFNGPVTQLSGPGTGATLSGGTWEVQKGAALQFDVSALTTIAAGTSVKVHGEGAFSGLAGLTQNAGALRLLDGADLTITGAFTNSGDLTLSPGTIFSTGSFTQISAGSVEFQIGGSSAGQSGKLAVTNAATLAGTAHVNIVGGFGSVAGQSVTVMSYASKAGSFATIDGLNIGGVPYFEASTGATALAIKAIRDAADLQPQAISAPSSGFLGQPVTISFTVRNLKNVVTLASTWTDAVYLSADSTLDDSDVRIGGAVHTGGLGANGSYNATITAPLPPAVPGSYHIIVVVDEGLQLPDSDRFNNAVATVGTITTDLEHIAHGVTKVATVSAGQSLYYQLDEPAGRDVLLTGSVSTAGAARFFAKSGGIPTESNFDVSATSLTDLQQKLALFGSTNQPYYLLIEGADAAGSGQSVSLSTRELGFEIVGTSPQSLPNVTTQQITISGSHFTDATTVRLVDSLGAELTPTNVVVQNSNTLVAQFPLGSVKPGLYDVRLTDNGAVAQADDVLQIVPAQATHSGTISSSEHWFGGLVHYVTSSITVPSGVTLTIDPDAIVKFAPFAGMQVDSGGSLVADGTLAQPIIFTSLRDDAHGGDTNSDGTSTAPLAGDWGTILVNGTGVFDHAELLYGGGSPSGTWSGTAALRTNAGTVTFTNSAVRDAFFDGILAWGGTATIENSIFVRNDRAISAHPGSPVVVKNSTFDDNRIALLTHGGNLSVANSVVYNSIESGIQYDFGTFSGATNTDVFSKVAGSQNYRNLTNLTGTSGNISADPKFKNPSLGDYRLNFLSPAIDSASGANAPLTDFNGVARYDDPRTANTGTGSPAFADMGAFEFVENAPSNLDLVVTSVVGQPAVTGGDKAHVSWTLLNRGTDVIKGAWHDTLQLVSNDGTVVLDAGTVLTSATLAPGQSATFAADVTVPFGTEGQYHWQVKTNSAGEVFEGQNFDNNTGVSSERSELHVPTLPVGGAINGSFSSVNGALLYKVRPTPGTDVHIALDRADTGLTELFLGVGEAPTTTSFFAHTRPTDDAGATLDISGALDTDYYVLLVPRTLPGGSADFSLSSVAASFNLDSLGLTHGSNTGNVTIPLQGSQFGADLTARLVAPDGTVHAAQSVHVDSSSLAYATFDLKELDAGNYDVVVTAHGQTDSLNDAFHIAAGTAGDQVHAKIILPDRVRAGRIFTAYIEYTNVGDTDALAPIIELSSPTGNKLRLTGSDPLTSDLTFLGISPDGPAGILRPGETVRMPFQVQGIAGNNSIATAISFPTNDAYDFAALKTQMRPATSPGEFDTIFETAIHGSRTTVADYDKLLSDGATLYAQRNGETTRNIGEILAFLVTDTYLENHTRIRGHVFLDDGLHPAAGVLVSAVDATGLNTFTALSTADGLVRFIETPASDLLPTGQGAITIPAGTYSLSFEDTVAPANLQPVTVPTTGHSADQTWILQQGATLSGRAVVPNGVVFDPDAPTASVVAIGSSGAIFQTLLLENGTYQLKGLPNDTYTVSLASGGKFAAPLPLSGITVHNGQIIGLNDLVGTKGGSVSGTVLGPGNAPLAGVTVTATGLGDPVSVVTDSSGHFLLEHVTPGPHDLTAHLGSFASSTITKVPVAEGNLTSGETFTLQTLGDFHGLVKSGGGSAVAGAAVQLENAAGDILGLDVTDATGHYTLPNLNAGSYTLYVDGQRFALSTESVSLAAGEKQAHDVTLTAASSVHGLVRQAGSGTPLDSVQVELLTPDNKVIDTPADENGAWTFSRLPVGHYAVMLPDGSNRHEFDITGPSSDISVNFDLTVGTLAGQVKLPKGVTLSGHTTVALLKDGQVMWETTVAPDGSYGFDLITPGSYDLAFSDSELDYSVVHGVAVVAGKNTPVPAVSPGTSSLQITATDAGSSGPAGEPGFISLTQLGVPDSQANVIAVPPSGKISADHLAPGDYLVSVVLPNHAVVQKVVTVGAGTSNLDLTAPAAGTLSGQVTDGSAGVQGLTVTVYDAADGRIHWQAVTDATGHYKVPVLPGGNFKVLVTDERSDNPSTRFAAIGDAFTLTTGGTVTKDVTVSVGNITLSGDIADGTAHRPSAGVAVAFNSDNVRVAEATIDPRGHYTFSTLTPGTYTIRAEADGFVVDSRNVTLTGGETHAGFDLVAHWYVDPPGLSDFFSGITSTLSDLVVGIGSAVKTVLVPPTEADALHRPPFDLLPPDCPCPKAYGWWRNAVGDDAFARQTFESLQDLFDANVGINSANVGLFGAKLGLLAARLYLKGAADAGKVDIGSSITATEQKLGDLHNQYANGEITFAQLNSQTEALQGVRDSLSNLLGFAKSASTLRSGVTSGISAVQNGEGLVQLTFGALGKFVKHPSAETFLGALDKANSLTSAIAAYDAAVNLLFGGSQGALGKKIADITAYLAPILQAAKGVVELKEGYDAYLERKEQYDHLIEKRDLEYNYAYKSIIECLITCHTDDPPNHVPNPPDRTFHHPPPQDTPGVESFDPNDKLTTGYGADHFVQPGTTLPYTVLFENKASASAPAQVVTVTDQLSPNLDWSTVELGDIGFNGVNITVPTGLTHFETSVNVSTDPTPVHVVGDFNATTGKLSWTISCVDKTTGDLPEDPLSGFLPPNNSQHQGEGFVSYVVKPLGNLTSGTAITNQAHIVFDVNAPIDTPTVTNTIDGAAPTSSVNALPASESNASFQVTWSGNDGTGSGIANYDIFVSDNGAAFKPFLLGTTDTSATFDGVLGHSYRFYSVAVDNVGNLEAAPGVADAVTAAGQFVSIPKTGQSFTDGDGTSYTVKLTGNGTAKIIQGADGGIGLLQLTGTDAKSSVLITTKTGTGDGKVSLGGVAGNGPLAALTASTAFLTGAGIQLGGSLGKLTLGNVLDGADITLGGSATSKTTMSFGSVSDGTRITTPGILASLTATDIGDGRITAASLSKLITTAGAMDADLRITGALSSISVKTGVNDGTWIAGSFGSVNINGGTLAADVHTTGALSALTVKGGGLSGDLTVGSVRSINVTGGSLTSDIHSSGAVGAITVKTGAASGAWSGSAFGTISVTGGALGANIDTAGAISGVTVNGGALSGNLTARSFGAVSVTSGDLSGSLTSLTPAATLGKMSALKSLAISGGDLTGDIRTLGAIGAISINSSRTAVGGNVTDATVNAAKIAAIVVGKNLTDSVLLAGADLGADHAFGGENDTFGLGTIGAVRVQGNVVNSIIGAGYSNKDGTPKDADDAIVGATPAEKLANKIASLTINGQADGASYFVAGKFTAKPKIAGTFVDPTKDPLDRFLTA